MHPKEELQHGSVVDWVEKQYSDIYKGKNHEIRGVEFGNCIKKDICPQKKADTRGLPLIIFAFFTCFLLLFVLLSVELVLHLPTQDNAVV